MSWRDRPYSGGDRGGGSMMPGSMSFGLPKPPQIVTILLVVNLGVFVLAAITGGGGSFLYAIGAVHTDKPLEVWRLFTYQYLHSPGDVFHLVFNMIGLYFLGGPLVRHWGAKRFFVVYTACGIAGGMLFLLLSGLWPEIGGGLIGASGGVLGLLGACAVLFPHMMIILLFFPVPIRVAAVLFVGIYVLNLLSRGYNAGGDAAHLAGLVLGVLWAKYGRNWWPPSAAGFSARQRGPLGEWRDRRRRGAWQRKLQREADEQEEVDRILAKINRSGIGSLTRAEKRTLADATERQRRDANRHGRTDRL